MKRSILAVLLLAPMMAIGCGPTPDQAVGENAQLKERLSKSDAEISVLRSNTNRLQEENTRLQRQLAATTGGKGLPLEEQQKHLDVRKAELDKREQELIEREKTVEHQIGQRRHELDTEYGTRDQAVLKREQEIARKEDEFHQATNLSMKDIGEAQFIKKEFENMRSAKDDAIAKADRWLVFIWVVSIALILAVMGLLAMGMVLRSRQVVASQELKARQEVAKLLSSAIKAQLPPEQGALVVDAFNRLTHAENQRDVSSAASGGVDA